MIGLKVDGVEVLLDALIKAGKDADRAAEKCIAKAADVMQDAMKEEMRRADPSERMAGLVSRMPPPRIEKNFGRYRARVGYPKGSYNPNNVSDGYKATFLNYGTQRRRVHGQIGAMHFISKAKNKAARRIKKLEESAFDEIVKDLK